MEGIVQRDRDHYVMVVVQESLKTEQIVTLEDSEGEFLRCDPAYRDTPPQRTRVAEGTEVVEGLRQQMTEAQQVIASAAAQRSRKCTDDMGPPRGTGFQGRTHRGTPGRGRRAQATAGDREGKGEEELVDQLRTLSRARCHHHSPRRGVDCTEETDQGAASQGFPREGVCYSRGQDLSTISEILLY